jgi:hypothetical protein
MITDEHGNNLLDDVETRVAMEMQEWRRGDVIAEWTFHGEYRFRLIREDENQYRHGRERQARYQRRFRLWEERLDVCGPDPRFLHWIPSLGGQWHDSIRSGYERAKMVADCYHHSKVERQKQQEGQERRRLAESLRPRYIREMNRRISTW